LFDRIASALAYSSGDLYTTGSGVAAPLPPANNLARVTETVIQEAVADGNVVFVGRGAQACLANADDAIHVFTVGPIDWRTQRVSEVLNLSAAEARKRVEGIDSRRRKYVKQNYGRDWEDPSNYSLCIDTSKISFERAASLISKAAQWHGSTATR
jgi:cytidylate kinase